MIIHAAQRVGLLPAMSRSPCLPGSKYVIAVRKGRFHGHPFLLPGAFGTKKHVSLANASETYFVEVHFRDGYAMYWVVGYTAYGEFPENKEEAMNRASRREYSQSPILALFSHSSHCSVKSKVPSLDKSSARVRSTALATNTKSLPYLSPSSSSSFSRSTARFISAHMYANSVHAIWEPTTSART